MDLCVHSYGQLYLKEQTKETDGKDQERLETAGHPAGGSAHINTEKKFFKFADFGALYRYFKPAKLIYVTWYTSQNTLRNWGQIWASTLICFF